MRRLFSHDSSRELRFFCAIFLAIFLVILDARFGALVKIRHYLDNVVTPLYFLTNSPGKILDRVSRMLKTHQQYELENQTLRLDLFLKNIDLEKLKQLKKENSQLRALMASPLVQIENKMITEVLSISRNPYSDQIVINKGSIHGVYEGQPVINDKGIVGQVISVSQVTSRVLLICDTSHAIPVQVLRNDIRAVAVGRGCQYDLLLDYLNNDVDIHNGDILLTSGLGGRFPEGYPVAVVSSVQVDSQRADSIITARPTANLKNLRYLLLIWDKNYHANMPFDPQMQSTR
ncbi:rod shape-determining protein MreC [Candidatus Williamhamiltonella defendens]|uniref:rod shape-determining protein MreC n=1 Tax=Candidatus Williamhamiltonella defendens TaxID=138072 RepID=UPI00130D9FBD|nr:rod shape-determining protein MreC [Candidatus Hamiltonella defensa]